MLRPVVFLMAYSLPVILATCHGGKDPPNIQLDGYTVNTSFGKHEANLTLGTTLVLSCQVSGLRKNEMRKFTWMCPNYPCMDKKYAGRNIISFKNESFLTINITSERDSGNYTCTVSTAEDCEFSMRFHLNVTGGEVVHSYGRLILNERVISDSQQLQPPNKPRGAGKIECRVMNDSIEARFMYYGLNETITKLKRPPDDSKFEFNSTVIIKRKLLKSEKFAIEGKCGSLYHYLFLNQDADCLNVTQFVDITSSGTSITVTIGELPCGIARVIVGYARLVEEVVWVEGEYVNLRECEAKTFYSLKSGEEYRITAWGLSGGNTNNRRRCQSPTVSNITI